MKMLRGEKLGIERPRGERQGVKVLREERLGMDRPRGERLVLVCWLWRAEIRGKAGNGEAEREEARNGEAARGEAGNREAKTGEAGNGDWRGRDQWRGWEWRS